MLQEQNQLYLDLMADHYQPDSDRRILYEESIQNYGLSAVMDNFRCRLPADYQATKPYSTSYRQLEAYIGIDPNLPYGLQEQATLYRDGKDPENNYSHLFLGLTPTEFYQLIDHALTQTDITLEEALEIRREWRNRELNSDQINTRLKPAFLLLIEMGFTYQDIAS